MNLPTLLAGLALSAVALEQLTPDAPPATQAAFSLADLTARVEASGKPWLPFLQRASLDCGVYRLAVGAEDRQAPHEWDEVYYVAEGKARLRAGADTFAAEPGSIFFVERDIEHRFTDVEEELVVLVFFSKHVPEK